jgi:hypothetical protein
VRWAEDLQGKVFVVLGGVEGWPDWMGHPPDALSRRGAVVEGKLRAGVDYVVLGTGRFKGRAAAERQIQKLKKEGATFELLDSSALVQLARPQLEGARFYFVGEFDVARAVLGGGHPREVLPQIGAVEATELDESVDFVVIGPKRAPGKLAGQRKAVELAEKGALVILDEGPFLELLRGHGGPGAGGLLIELHGVVDAGRLKRALDMLQAESMRLYSARGDDRLVGVVKSQTSTGVYSNVLYADGRYSCCSEDLEECMGLLHAGEADAQTLLSWVRQASRQAPVEDSDTLADTLLRYKAAQSGEIDWRPTETLPEDFYAL